MLSRVAETIYWIGRYLERAENTARLINVNTNLMLDLPKGIAPGWEPLIRILGCENDYAERHEEITERRVVNFLISDEHNPGSILSTLGFARENARTIRDILPREGLGGVQCLPSACGRSQTDQLCPTGPPRLSESDHPGTAAAHRPAGRHHES